MYKTRTKVAHKNVSKDFIMDFIIPKQNDLEILKF